LAEYLAINYTIYTLLKIVNNTRFAVARKNR